MSNRIKVVLIIIAGLILVVVGIFASATLIQRLRPSQEPATVEEVTVKTDVVVMTRDLYLGDTVAAGDVKLSSVPVEIAPRNVLTTVEEAVGKIVKTDLIQGEMLLSHNLADPTNSNNDLSFVLSDNHVLMAFPADDLMSRESMIQTGDIVDIFATFTEKVKTVGETSTTDETDEPETRTFTVDTMQNVTITAMVLDVIVEEEEDTSLLDGGDGESTKPAADIEAYLLALDPQDALILKHLKDTEAIFDIVLRSPTSTVQFYLTPVTEEYIIEFYGLEILP